MSIQTVMVIGAGQMGGGIAQVMAQAGRKTYLNDVDIDIVMKRIDFIKKLLEKDVAKGKITEEQKEAALANLIPSVDQKDAADCDLVVEAIVENMAVKGKVFANLDQICKPSCILASNTSSLPITEIAAFTQAAGAGHRDALHEPGAGDEAGGDHPGAGHQPGDL